MTVEMKLMHLPDPAMPECDADYVLSKNCLTDFNYNFTILQDQQHTVTVIILIIDIQFYCLLKTVTNNA